MSVRSFVSRLLAARRRDAIDAELAEEIEEHLRLAAQERIAEGMSPEDARAVARRAFGNPTLARESSRNAWGWPALDAWLADLRFGLRIARKHAASTLVAIGSLGIAVGVTSSVVSLLYSVTHPDYPFAQPDRLAALWAKSTRVARYDAMQISVPELREWQRAATQTAVAGLTWSQSVNLAANGAAPMRSSASMVTSNLLSVLGVAPMLGRAFTASDERDDAPNTAIVTYDFWKERLRGSGAALSTPLVVDRVPYAVIGVLPPDFRLPLLLKVKVLLPLRRTPWMTDRSARSVMAIGRLAPRATVASATEELTRITTQFNDASAEDRNGWVANVQPFSALARGRGAQTLGILLALAGVVLLIACANVAILLLARVPARQHELMVRLALGAERRRLMSQLFAESAWLAAGGALLGAAIAPLVMRVLVRLIQGSLSFELPQSLYGMALLFPLGIAVATCLVFGLAPAVSAIRSLRDAGTLTGARTSGAAEQEWLRSVLMAAEVALSIVLVVGGWLMIETVVAVHGRPLGFDANQLVTARLLLDTTRYRSAVAQHEFYATLAARLRTHGELRDATVSSIVPLATGGDFANYATRDPVSVDDKTDTLTASSNAVMPDYFDAMHIPMLAGRMFNGREDEPVVVVNETLAQRLWPGRSAVGQRLRVLAPMYTDGEAIQSGERRIVGVVPDVRPPTVHPNDGWPSLFVPYSQQPLRGMYVAVRAENPAAGASAIRSEVAALDPLLPVFAVKSADQLFDDWFASMHLNALIIDVLAAIGTLLTLIGIYSVVAVFVSQRTREIGIRIAVGAQRRDVVRMVLRRTIRPAVVGAVTGSAAALLGVRTIASLLHGVSPFEPRAFAGAGALLVLVVVAAALIPARHAARLDPLTALRTE